MDNVSICINKSHCEQLCTRPKCSICNKNYLLVNGDMNACCVNGPAGHLWTLHFEGKCMIANSLY